jgi:two-component system chemotaxis response regulator CheV
MSKILQLGDERAKPGGSDRLEVLLFSLGMDSTTGRDEVFGLNVFKVREVMRVPQITHAPDMPDAVEGVISLRGAMVPVINLPKFCGVQTEQQLEILIVTEHNKRVQGFLVPSVDTIEQLNWDVVQAPPGMLKTRLGSLVTSVAELSENQLVMIIDVEKVLAETTSYYETYDPLSRNPGC